MKKENYTIKSIYCVSHISLFPLVRVFTVVVREENHVHEIMLVMCEVIEESVHPC